MKEEFLHYLWKYQNFNHKNMYTPDGEELEILHPGYVNSDAGPDFREARIRIGKQLWVGQVEIHVKATDWNRHGHQNDEAYKNVILHLVYKNDGKVADSNNNQIPALELKNRFDDKQYERYCRLTETMDLIPCEKQLREVDPFIVESMLERVLVERLEQKSEAIREILQRNKGDWNETFYQWIARGYGLKINAEPMLIMAQNLPQKILGKHKKDIFQIEALLFGIAGLLENVKDQYGQKLKREFHFLKAKYKLKQTESFIWKFARLRPASFPVLRIAQFAALIHQSESLFSHILEAGEIARLKEKLSTAPSEYWKTHYRFDIETEERRAEAGDKFKDVLIINVIVPFLFIYGLSKDEPFYKQRALDLLEQLKAEKNKISRIFEQSGLKLRSALHSQACIQLYHHYCEHKKCLNCGIGIHLLRR